MEGIASKFDTAARWAARALTIFVVLLWGTFLVAHAFGDQGNPSRALDWRDYAMLGTLVVAIAGLIVAWARELPGATISCVAMTCCALLNWRVLVFPGVLIPAAALLYLAAWSSGRHQRRVSRHAD